MRRRDFIALFGCTAAAWPLSVRAQQSAMPVIGFMSARSPDDSGPVLQAFFKGLGEAGFFDGQNVTIEYRWARGEYGRLPALAAEFVRRRVNVLVATGGLTSAVAAKHATSTIPIVFVMGDPVKAGLVESYNRPGGNATGAFLATTEMEPKRLGLLHELTPGVSLIGALLNPNSPDTAHQLRELEQAARTIGRNLFVAKASDDEELNAAFVLLLRQGIGACSLEPIHTSIRDAIVSLRSRHKIVCPPYIIFRRAPSPAAWSAMVQASPTHIGRRAITPDESSKEKSRPICQFCKPTKYELVINLKTAKALGLAIAIWHY